MKEDQTKRMQQLAGLLKEGSKERIEIMFDVEQVDNRGIIRRRKENVASEDLAELKAEVKRRKFKLYEDEHEYVVLCDKFGNLTEILL